MSSPRSRSGGKSISHDVDAVIQILAKSFLADHFFQRPRRGGHHPHVDGDFLAPANAANLPLLQRAQQLGLQHQRQFAQLVEEERAVIGKFQQADPPAFGAGEGALFVAEEFALQQALGNRSAIDRHERPFGPPAAAMNAAGDQFLAGAGLAANQHVDVGVGHLLESFRTPSASADSRRRCCRSYKAARLVGAAGRIRRRCGARRAAAGHWPPGRFESRQRPDSRRLPGRSALRGLLELGLWIDQDDRQTVVDGARTFSSKSKPSMLSGAMVATSRSNDCSPSCWIADAASRWKTSSNGPAAARPRA